MAQEQQGLQAADIFRLADAAIAAERFDDAGILYRALVHDADPDMRAEARFRLGMMMADRQKRFRDAATIFRALLDEKPDAVRVRLELARVLALMGDEASARRQVRQAQSAGLPPDVAVVVDLFANALRSTKPLGGSIELALAPDSNINRATDARTLDTVIAPLNLSRDARAQSGLGLKLGGQGYARFGVGGRVALLGRVSTIANLYKASQFNDISLSVQAGPEITFTRDRLRPAVGVTHRYYGGNLYARTATASLNWRHTLSRRAQFDADVSVSPTHYARNPLQDGTIYDASVTLERALTPRMGGSVTLLVNRQTARDPGYATTAGGASLVLWRDLGRTTLFGSATYRHLRADERLFLFTSIRTDNLYRVAGGATLRHITVQGFAPVLRLIWERNQSTVGIYDYRRRAFELGVTRAF